jgi:hypothetical protein
MKWIQYQGPADFQQYDAQDLQKAGVEDAGALSFAKGEPREVPDEIADALVGNETGLYGDFIEVDEPDEEEVIDEPSAFVQPPAGTDAMTDSGTLQQDVSPPGSSGSTSTPAPRATKKAASSGKS